MLNIPPVTGGMLLLFLSSVGVRVDGFDLRTSDDGSGESNTDTEVHRRHANESDEEQSVIIGKLFSSC